MKLIDTHCHIDADCFDADRGRLVQEAARAGLVDALICSGFAAGFSKSQRTAHSTRWHYALGIHPLFLPEDDAAVDRDVLALRLAAQAALADPRFAAIGEIGLDAWVKTLPWERQLRLFAGQLKVARDLALPVSVHARHCPDAVACELRRWGVRQGVIHAFNGSEVQAERFLNMGFKLGFGGALLYSGSRRIRRIFTSLGPQDFVFETDAPDMPAPWRRQNKDPRTHPADIARYVEEGALLRGVNVELLSEQSRENALEAFPRLRSV